jgi:inorganic pyrophosphatase
MTNKTNFEVAAIVEIPYGSRYKYEVDKKSGALMVDRLLKSPIPYNYGYVPGTLHGDGDPLDICILGQLPIHPMTKVKVKLVGALKCTDNGFSDDKLLGVVIGDDLTLIGPCTIEVQDYLNSYKEGFVVESYIGPEEAYNILMKDVDSYQNA